MSYDQLRALCERQFGPRLNAMVARFKFGQQCQHQGESVRRYVCALRELDATFMFGALHDEMIRDQHMAKLFLSR